MNQSAQAQTGDFWPWGYPYSNVMPFWQWPYPTIYGPDAFRNTYLSDKTFADHIAIAKEARETSKRMRRYRRIR